MNESKQLKQQTANLASPDELTQEFSKDFDATNLPNMRRFYMAFPIQETVSLKLNGCNYKYFLRDPYIFNFLNQPGQNLLNDDLEKKRMRIQAKLQYKRNGKNHD